MLSPEPNIVGRFEEHTLPDGSVVYYEPEKHQYFGEVKESAKAKGGFSFVRDSRLQGVSTIAKFLDPDPEPLMHWAAKLDQIGIADLAARDAAAGVHSTGWLQSQEAIAARLREHEATWSHVRNRAAMRGTDVHEHIFLALATGSTPPSLANLSEEARGYGQAVFAWWRERQPEPIAAEQLTLSHQLKAAGRFDLLAKIGHDTVLIDAKTREKPRTYLSDHVQLAGYKRLNLESEIGESDREMVLVLLPDGTFQEFEGQGTDADFNAAVLASQSGKHLERRMREASKAREAVTA